jgi:hypothetical protein
VIEAVTRFLMLSGPVSLAQGPAGTSIFAVLRLIGCLCLTLC